MSRKRAIVNNSQARIPRQSVFSFIQIQLTKMFAPLIQFYLDLKVKSWLHRQVNTQTNKPKHQRCAAVFMPFGDLKEASPFNVDIDPIRIRRSVGQNLGMDYRQVMQLPKSMTPATETGASNKIALTFDGVDSVVQFPAYLFQHTVFLWIQNLLEYTSFLDSLRECNPLYNALSIYQKQMDYSVYGIYEKETEHGEALNDEELEGIGADFFKKMRFKTWRAMFNQYKFICGNVYVAKTDKYFALDGKPFQQFCLLPPQYIVPSFGDSLEIDAYYYRPGIKVYDWLQIPPKDLIHFKATPNPRLPILGMGLVEANRNSIQTWLDLKSLFSHVAANGMFPSVAIIGRPEAHFNQEDIAAISGQLTAMNSGKGNYSKGIVLPSAADIKELNGGFNMDVIERTSMLCDALVYSAFEIPSHFWVQNAKQEPKFKNMEESINVFRQGPINTAWADIKDVADEILKILELDDKYEFRYSLKYESNREDMLLDVQNGNMTRAEYRERVSYGHDENNIDALETYTVLNTTVALEHAINNAPQPVPVKPEAGTEPGNAANKDLTVPMPGEAKPGISAKAAGVAEKGGPGSGRYPAGSGNNGGTSGATHVPFVETVGVEAARAAYLDYYTSQGDLPGAMTSAWRGVAYDQGRVPSAIKMIKRASSGWRTKAAGGFKSQPIRGRVSKEQGKALAHDIKRLTDATAIHHNSTVTFKIKQALKVQKDRIKSALLKQGSKWDALVAKYGKGEGKKAATPNREIKVMLPDIFDNETEDSFMGDNIQAIYSTVTPDALENMTQAMGIKPNKLSDTVNLFGRDNAPKVNDTTKQALEDYLKEAIDNNLTLNDTAAGMEDMFEFSPARSEMISRTEITRALDKANTDFMKNSGVVKTYMVVGCEDNETDCNATDIDPDELDSLDFHPNHTGVIVPQDYNEGDDEDDNA
jgi:hypothetical protein